MYPNLPYFLGGSVRFASLVSALCIITLMLGAPAWANMVITPAFDTTITSDPNKIAIENTINAAIAIYENDFADPITVNIKFQEMSSGLGMSTTFFSTVSYSQYLTALTADAKTSDDATALAHLPPGPNNPVNGTASINVKTANLRAVGINVNPPTGQPDGTIGLNTSMTNPGSPGSSNAFSLLVTTEHEIDEVLGLGSALPNPPSGSPFPEDLFRYDASGARSFTTTATAKAFFSLNGTTDLAQFDNQNDGGDFGDWQSNPLPTGVQPKVQDAFATSGATPALGVELRALDVIGYDLIAPEPGTGVLLAAALIVLGGLNYARVSRRARLPREPEG
jgi:hypothetical protein